MQFSPTEEQKAVQKTAHEFATNEVLPKAAEIDREHRHPAELVKRMAELGFLGIAIPEEYGGSGFDHVSYALAMEEVSRACASTGVIMSVNNSLVCDPIYRFGTEEQKKEWLVPLASGKLLGCFALSEPEAGSDPAAMRTIATKTANGWSLRGSKQWISSGDHAGVMVVWAVTDAAAGHKGITAFVVGGQAKGLTVTRLEDKLGLHGSSTAQLAFDDVEVGDDAVLGRVGGGFALAMIALDGGRIGIASQAIGIARGALEATIRYAGERRTMGQAIIKHQAIGNMLADAATWLDASTLMTLRAAAAKQHGQPFSQLAAMAKLFSTERAWEICDICLQVHGGYGYVRDFPVERALRDVRATRIYEGTSEIQRIVIARNLLRAQ